MNTFNTIILFLCLLTCGMSKNHEHAHHAYDYYNLDVKYRSRERKLSSIDWCSLSCGQEKNIVCQNGAKCDPKSPCKHVTLNKEQIVDMHNKLRTNFAIGIEEKSGGITVSNMIAVKWNENLAYTAACNLVECTGLKYDTCHSTPEFQSNAGQNIWTWTGATDTHCAEKVEEGIQSWYDEVSLTTPEKIKRDSQAYEADSNTSHFSQIIWASTTHIGCSMTKKLNNSETTCTMTCNYGPGIIKGARVFDAGVPCNECFHPIFPYECNEDGLCWIDDAGQYLRPNIPLLVLIYFVFKSVSFLI